MFYGLQIQVRALHQDDLYSVGKLNKINFTEILPFLTYYTM